MGFRRSTFKGKCFIQAQLSVAWRSRHAGCKTGLWLFDMSALSFEQLRARTHTLVHIDENYVRSVVCVCVLE